MFTLVNQATAAFVELSVIYSAVVQVEEFVGISAALLINMGTLSSDWLASKKLAAKRVGAMFEV